jgi:glycosyltransferase involved in cell wall biosynthesis
MISAARSKHSIKLAFFPDWSQSNPYQKLLYDEMEASGISCHGMQGPDLTFGWIFRNCKKIRFIHIHWLYGIYNSKANGLCWIYFTILVSKILIARILRYKILWTVHNLVAHETQNLKLETISRKIMARIAHHLIVHCEYARASVSKSWSIGLHKVTAIPHGSYIGYYPNVIGRKDARHELTISDNSFTFLFFGMLRNYKGFKELLRSYKELKNRNSDIHLIIAGNPHSAIIRQEIEELTAGEGISLHLRYITDEEVQLYFNASDVVVLPYLNILTSGAAVLALSFGKPVVAPGKGCIPELLDESTGFLYNNERELTVAMSAAANNKGIAEMGKQAMEKAESLSWSRIVAEYYIPLLRRP